MKVTANSGLLSTGYISTHSHCAVRTEPSSTQARLLSSRSCQTTANKTLATNATSTKDMDRDAAGAELGPSATTSTLPTDFPSMELRFIARRFPQAWKELPRKNHGTLLEVLTTVFVILRCADDATGTREIVEAYDRTMTAKIIEVLTARESDGDRKMGGKGPVAGEGGVGKASSEQEATTGPTTAHEAVKSMGTVVEEARATVDALRAQLRTSTAEMGEAKAHITDLMARLEDANGKFEMIRAVLEKPLEQF